jgi:hypothetical protein
MLLFLQIDHAALGWRCANLTFFCSANIFLTCKPFSATKTFFLQPTSKKVRLICVLYLCSIYVMIRHVASSVLAYCVQAKHNAPQMPFCEVSPDCPFKNFVIGKRI